MKQFANNSATATAFLGFDAEIQFRTERSIAFELTRRTSPNECEFVGWLDVHYPCAGPHALHVRACLNPEITKFTSHVNFGGDPSAETDALMVRLISEVIEFLKLASDVTWHLDLQSRGVGTFVQNPNTTL